MGLLDLGKVTSALTALLESRVHFSPAWFPSAGPVVSPLPPDKLPADALGMYLYHVVEDASLKNLPPMGSGSPPIAFQPMALQLYYQLTANSDTNPTSALRAQRVIGCAMKALHDTPVIHDGTTVTDPGTGLAKNLLADFGLDGRGNRIRVELLARDPREAVDYWTAGQVPLRLAAYYRVSVVLLEAEPAPSASQRVLRTSIGMFVSGTPTLQASRNRVEVLVPGLPDPQELVLQPAQVAPGDTLDLLGNDLVGDATTLRLEGGTLEAPIFLDPTLWSISASRTEIHATVRSPVEGRVLVPGTYTVRAVVDRTVTGRTVRQVSNGAPLTIAPAFADPGAQAPGVAFTLTGGVFEDPEIPTADQDDPNSVQVYLGGDRIPLSDVVPPNPLPVGTFRILDADNLELSLPAATAAGHHPLRVRVRGVETRPYFLEVT